MKGTGRILNGKIYMEKNLEEYIQKFEEEAVDIEIVVINKPAHYLYKYLHGYLLLSMVEFLGDNKEDLYMDLKERFAMEEVAEWSDIPKRHRAKCQRYEIDNEFTHSKYYIKSAGAMTHEELKDFVQQIENHYFDFCQGRISDKIQEAAKSYRTRGFMTPQQLKKFKGGIE